ncbi:Imm1 family immunity protein [Streptomyces sp. NPDC059479]|uniref:Imm1 family immunity protein n=1 Tax=Streptomyces sp. NPDC059479 TaxID=3346848 RepID=UPI0036BF5F55
MILEFWINGEMKRTSEWSEVEVAIGRVPAELESERAVPVGFDAGSIAAFHFFDIPAGSEVPRTAENALHVGLNRTTGYGGMTWWGEKIPESPNQFYWVTKSNNPPSFDPRVTADPGYPLWYDKQNVIPVDEVEAALKEFCLNKGKRPTVVEWEPGTVNGQSLSLMG